MKYKSRLFDNMSVTLFFLLVSNYLTSSVLPGIFFFLFKLIVGPVIVVHLAAQKGLIELPARLEPLLRLVLDRA